MGEEKIMFKKKTIAKAFLAVFCFFSCLVSLRAESCSTAGEVQYKYTASGCSYITQKRTCCATTGQWSDWDASCPSCTSNQCWNGSYCEDKQATTATCGANTTGTTVRRTAVCIDGKGWSYGEWGECKCSSTLYYPSVLRCDKCWKTYNGIQTYYILSKYGDTCCQPQCCATGTCSASFKGVDPCCHKM